LGAKELIMHMLAILFATAALGQSSALEPEHEANPVYKALMHDGLELAGTKVHWPAPVLHDGQTAEEERAALKTLLGSERAVDDFLRDSVTAPEVVRIPSEPPSSQNTDLVRQAAVWFVVYADISALDPEGAAKRAGRGEPVEAGNMKFQSVLLKPSDLKAQGLHEPDPKQEWYAHVTGSLLYRIHVEATDQTFATKSADSVVVASRTAREFDRDQELPNVWWPVTTNAGREEKGTAQVYAGGASYSKISRIKGTKGALLVECHLAFAEPKAWFDGAPILRSKITLVAQDQIRRLRRELAKQRNR
jgi:hypothetical protein